MPKPPEAEPATLRSPETAEPEKRRPSKRPAKGAEATSAGNGAPPAAGRRETRAKVGKRPLPGSETVHQDPVLDSERAWSHQEVHAVSGAAAFGAPGVPATWAHGSKQAVGTCLTSESPVWFTVAEGVLTEIYYPRVDLANTRDVQFLLVGGDGEAFFEERRDTLSKVELADPRALIWDVTNSEAQGRFRITKRILTAPDRPAVVVRAQITAGSGRGKAAGLTPYLLVAPHVGDRGMENTARVVTTPDGRTLLMAHRYDTHMAVACSLPLEQASAGFSGVSDGFTQLRQDGRVGQCFARAENGNVALVAALGGDPSRPFQLAVGFGRTAAEAAAHACDGADADFGALEREYARGWHEYCDGLVDLGRVSGDAGRLYHLSAMVLRAHEDRENPGAHIASLAIPWGEAQGDRNRAGYHLVWPRDLYHAATARLAAGDAAGALRTLHYLARTQRADGSWPQNFWVFGEPYWRGLQLDEIAFPVLLAWQLRRANALDWNPYPALVAPAAYRIARVGPVTEQERWEENSGYSPSTLAVAIAALVCAAEFAQADRDPSAVRYFLQVADYWARHLDDWTFTTEGDVDGGSQYYERIAPVLTDVPGHLGRTVVHVANVADGQAQVEERSVIDGGFLELVRYGIRKPDDPRIRQTLQIYDAECKVETPQGPVWHRYTHDGYGEHADGSPYTGTGIGRAWPLLTGERAHYELASGAAAAPLLRAMERMVTAGGMIPEQVWDGPDLPERGLYLGRPTGSAAPLVWAHAEYIKLLRSMIDGDVFDCPPLVRRRYLERRGGLSKLLIWKHNHKIRTAAAADGVRIEAYGPAALHWTDDGWATVRHEPMEPLGRGVWVYDLLPDRLAAGQTVEFTFWWNESGTWEGANHAIQIV